MSTYYYGTNGNDYYNHTANYWYPSYYTSLYVQGGAGSDTIYGEAYNDTIFGYDYDSYGYGYDGNDSLSGGGGNDYIYGDYGDDYIDGGTGYDTMYGGAGNDYYVVYSAYDYVYEYAGEGSSDWVYSYVNYSLGSNVENLYLLGTAYSGYGNSLDNTIVGNYYYSNYLDGGAGNDYIYGGYYNDYLYGGTGNDYISADYGNDYIDGGSGYDTMYGGYGNDYYVVDSAYNYVYEYASEGTDTVYSYVSYSLGSNVENLTLGYGAYYGYGNSLDNVLTGYYYNSYNYLDGGAGNDTIYGGYYNDYLYGGTGNDYLLGGYGNDYVCGEDGNDYLLGGYGNDTVVGGYGNDTLNAYGGGTTEIDYLYGRTGSYNYGCVPTKEWVINPDCVSKVANFSSLTYKSFILLGYCYTSPVQRLKAAWYRDAVVWHERIQKSTTQGMPVVIAGSCVPWLPEKSTAMTIFAVIALSFLACLQAWFPVNLPMQVIEQP